MGEARLHSVRVQLSLLLPTLTSVLSCGFAVLLAARFGRRRRTYYAAWAMGLACFGVSSAAEALGSGMGWSVGLYRAWYWSGAICVAAFLGAGSLYLHAGRVVHWLTVGLVVLGCVPAVAGGYFIEALVGCAVAARLAVVQWRRPHTFAGAALALLIAAAALAAVRVSTVSLDPALLPAQGDIATGRAFPESVRILTPMFNIPGALILLVGAAISAVRWREAPARLASNALIALGAFVPSLASSLTRLGDSQEFYLGQLIGVLCLLGGFVVSDLTSGQPRLRPSV